MTLFIVDEMFSLRGHVETISNKSYNEANKQMRQLSRNAEHLTTDLKVLLLFNSSISVMEVPHLTRAMLSNQWMVLLRCENDHCRDQWDKYMYKVKIDIHLIAETAVNWVVYPPWKGKTAEKQNKPIYSYCLGSVGILFCPNS